MPKNKVLIVEDEQDIAGLIKHTLERGGDADVEVVGSGDAALEGGGRPSPDLIILDLNLPVLSGVEVCRILRGRADGRNVPIIMLTARTARARSRRRPRDGRRRLRDQAVQPPRADRACPRRAAPRPQARRAAWPRPIRAPT